MKSVRYFSFPVWIPAFAGITLSLFFLLSCGIEQKGTGLVDTALSFSPTSAGGAVSTASVASAQTFTQGVAQVIIEEAAFVIRRIKFKAADSHEEDFKAEALVVTLNLEGTSNVVSISKIPVGTYDRIKFEIHKLEASEMNAIDLTAHPEFSEFAKDNGYSVFVRGTYDNDISDNIAPKPFVFRSRFNEIQEHFLNPPLEIKEGQNLVDVHLSIQTDRWFVMDGVIVDPTNANLEPQIDNNIKNSIKQF